ncbi:hypothetical protein Cgig2_033102 [Carnegiea gigantea]|uniref:DUF676 domain-containing protein n=1 Tax=Carnegiea gigantea TaxID=171969 RepID=A0A9Q1K1B2_9CARY|nr:hypothetical protein Cgig2_033102 [Carnegiea gigantea]
MGSCCVSDWRKIQKQKKKLRKKLEIESLAGGQDVMGSAMAKAEACPDHLVVMVNGIIGSASEWKFAAQQFVKLLPDKVIVEEPVPNEFEIFRISLELCWIQLLRNYQGPKGDGNCLCLKGPIIKGGDGSTCNPTNLTFDGVDLMGDRLANEVLAVVNHWPGLQKISFIAHSLGGLVVRYAIGMLYEPLKRSEEEDSSHKLEKHEDYHKDRIAGLEPMNFITVATPHLGSRGHRQLPCLCGLHFLEWKFTKAAHLIAGRSGEHLFLTDIDMDKPPLLIRMASDSYELKFMSGDLGYNEKYPHIVYIEPETFRDTDCRGSSNMENQMTDFEGASQNMTISANVIEESSFFLHFLILMRSLSLCGLVEEMIKGLNQVPWKRIHVNFRKGTQRWIAHSTIEASNKT